jgi:hypothetical protein
MPSLCSARNYKQHICIHAGKFVLFLASIEAAPCVHPALLFVVSLFDLRAVAKTLVFHRRLQDIRRPAGRSTVIVNRIELIGLSVLVETTLNDSRFLTVPHNWHGYPGECQRLS